MRGDRPGEGGVGRIEGVRRVGHQPAGGLEVAKAWFAWYVTHVPTYRQIYGALAALPLFMLWLYVCWLIVLAGAAIVATLTPGSRRASDR